MGAGSKFSLENLCKNQEKKMGKKPHLSLNNSINARNYDLEKTQSIKCFAYI